MISILTATDSISSYFDVHSTKEGEMHFIVSALNTICPDVLEAWAEDAYYYSTTFDRWEILWCIDDGRKFHLANKIYNYIETFEFDVEIIEEKA